MNDGLAPIRPRRPPAGMRPARPSPSRNPSREIQVVINPGKYFRAPCRDLCHSEDAEFVQHCPGSWDRCRHDSQVHRRVGPGFASRDGAVSASNSSSAPPASSSSPESEIVFVERGPVGLGLHRCPPSFGVRHRLQRQSSSSSSFSSSSAVQIVVHLTRRLKIGINLPTRRPSSYLRRPQS